jgi:thymidylate synthase ThyX
MENIAEEVINTVDFKPSAWIAKHSLLPALGPANSRELFTIVGNMHRFILAEFNTHRSFSRNSASSRAIPSKVLINLAETANVYPLEWGSNCKGMSAVTQILPHEEQFSRRVWDELRNSCVTAAKVLATVNIHKQVLNRTLELFLPHCVIFTTDRKGLNDFFELRISPNAQPEIREFAIAVREAVNNSIPQILRPGELHLPFVDTIFDYREVFNKVTLHPEGDISTWTEDAYFYSQPIYNSVAYCARVSYLGHEKNHEPESNERLFWDLYKNKHWSPFEHVAVGLSSEDKTAKEIRKAIYGYNSPMRQNYSTKFLQLRKVLESEHRQKPVPKRSAVSDTRVDKNI